MSSPLNFLAIPGSLRRDSMNRAVAHALAKLAPADVRVDVAELHALPMYDGDLDADGATSEVVAFREAIAAADALVFVTPEYNYGVPGVLKNAIDWASRPAYKSVLMGKPVGIVGAAASIVGSARAQGQLKQVLLATLAAVFPYPEVLITPKAFDGIALTDERTREILTHFQSGLAAWSRAVHSTDWLQRGSR